MVKKEAEGVVNVLLCMDGIIYVELRDVFKKNLWNERKKNCFFEIKKCIYRDILPEEPNENLCGGLLEISCILSRRKMLLVRPWSLNWSGITYGM